MFRIRPLVRLDGRTALDLRSLCEHNGGKREQDKGNYAIHLSFLSLLCGSTTLTMLLTPRS